MESIEQTDTKPVIGESDSQNILKPVSDSTDKPICLPKTGANSESVTVSVAKEKRELREEAISENDEPIMENEKNIEVKATEQTEALTQIAIQGDDKLEDFVVCDNTAANEWVPNGVALDELSVYVSKLQEKAEEAKSLDTHSYIIQSHGRLSPTTPPPKKPKVDLTCASAHEYLDNTVVPILLQGMSALANERPAKPITFLADFLLDKTPEYDDE